MSGSCSSCGGCRYCCCCRRYSFHCSFLSGVLGGCHQWKAQCWEHVLVASATLEGRSGSRSATQRQFSTDPPSCWRWTYQHDKVKRASNAPKPTTHGEARHRAGTCAIGRKNRKTKTVMKHKSRKGQTSREAEVKAQKRNEAGNNAITNKQRSRQRNSRKSEEKPETWKNKF